MQISVHTVSSDEEASLGNNNLRRSNVFNIIKKQNKSSESFLGDNLFISPRKSTFDRRSQSARDLLRHSNQSMHSHSEKNSLTE